MNNITRVHVLAAAFIALAGGFHAANALRAQAGIGQCTGIGCCRSITNLTLYQECIRKVQAAQPVTQPTVTQPTVTDPSACTYARCCDAFLSDATKYATCSQAVQRYLNNSQQGTAARTPTTTGGQSICRIIPTYPGCTTPPSTRPSGTHIPRPPTTPLPNNNTPKPVCGNGVYENYLFSQVPLEPCDDGNLASGDGCSSTCTIESGYACHLSNTTPTKSICARIICGDQQKTHPEECDDGNTANGDGCSNTCTVEAGYECSMLSSIDPVTFRNIPWPGSRCRSLCGNGTIQSPEQCDDGNVLAGDGCSATCAVEPTGTQPCTATTPTVTGSAWQNGQMPYDVNKDGVVTSADLTALLNELRSRGPSWLTTPNTTSLMPDVNGSRSLTNLDLVLLNSYLRQCGLQQTTPTTPPATTAPAPTPTVAVCGDRVVQGREQCDDGNTLPGDGCSPTCTRTTACTDGFDNDNDGLIDNGSDPGCDGTSTDNDETNARAELSVVSNTVAVAEVRRVTATVRSTATKEHARNNTKNTFRNDTRNTSTFI